MNISSIRPPVAPDLTPPSVSTEKGGGFKDVLSSAIQEVESSNNTAKTSVEQFLSGDGGELHSTILATQRAGLEFDLMIQVRNKIVSAYQEVMRMQM
ncbi:MAG TPA: flagellar hook-basal body complex protein FliE [Bryobacteraceae bacterium]|nr:flagellar hook-basal body complex protein FliE [Bryobacteraceae bacterium]